MPPYVLLKKAEINPDVKIIKPRLGLILMLYLNYNILISENPRQQIIFRELHNSKITFFNFKKRW